MTERDQLAAEYVLGLLEGEELLVARARAAREPDFVALVEQWEERFAPLLDEFPPMQPSADLWERIAAASGEDGPGNNVVALEQAVTRWKRIATAGFATAAAIALAVFIGPLGRDGPAAPTQAAPLLAANVPIGETELRLALTYVPDRAELAISAAGLTEDGVHDHELWLVDRAGELHSLGVVVPGEELRVPVAPTLAEEFVDGTQLVLTREPLGGKPPEAAAGPVVAQGQFSQI